jgi:hypothetical protein
VGKSIAISGTVGPPEAREALFRWVRARAAELEWNVRPIDLSFARASLRTAGGKLPLAVPKARGLSLLPHFACEEIPLICVGPEGTLVDEAVDDAAGGAPTFLPGTIVKTQFAGAASHREICEVLLEIRERFAPGLAVDDETGYFASRDDAALARALDEGWSEIRERIVADRPAPGSGFQVGHLQFEVPAEAPGKEFDAIAKADSAVVASADRAFVGRFGGFGTTLDHSRDSVLDFELAISDFDGANEVEGLEMLELASESGAYFGRTLVAVLGGAWKREDDRLVVADVGRTGLVVDPFQVAEDRLAHGPPHSFVHHFELYETVARHLAREGAA